MQSSRLPFSLGSFCEHTFASGMYEMVAKVQHLSAKTNTKFGDQPNPERNLLQYDPDGMTNFGYLGNLTNGRKRIVQNEAIDGTARGLAPFYLADV